MVYGLAIDENGKKLCVGTYNNGVKVGTWMFTGMKIYLNQVDYSLIMPL